MNKKVVLFSALGVLAALLVGYFVVVPYYQVATYRSDLKVANEKIDSAGNALVAFYNKDSFLRADSDPAQVRADIKIGLDFVKDLENTIDLYGSKLTNFNELPLLSLNPNYKTASEINKLQKQNAALVSEFLVEAKAVLAYAESQADVLASIDEYEILATKIQNSDSVEQLVAALDESIAKLDSIVASIEKISAPESVKEIHDYQIVVLNETKSIYARTKRLCCG